MQLPTGCGGIPGKCSEKNTIPSCISRSDSLPKHTPAPEQTRPSFFHVKERGSARCSNNLSFSIPPLSEEPLGMAGKERDLKIAADFLCSWRSFPEQRKTWSRANIPLPITVPRKGLGCRQHGMPYVLAWLGIASRTHWKRWEASKGRLPSSTSCDTPGLGLLSICFGSWGRFSSPTNSLVSWHQFVHPWSLWPRQGTAVQCRCLASAALWSHLRFGPSSS